MTRLRLYSILAAQIAQVATLLCTIGWANWVVWAAIKKYSHVTFTVLLQVIDM